MSIRSSMLSLPSVSGFSSPPRFLCERLVLPSGWGLTYLPPVLPLPRPALAGLLSFRKVSTTSFLVISPVPLSFVSVSVSGGCLTALLDSRCFWVLSHFFCFCLEPLLLLERGFVDEEEDCLLWLPTSLCYSLSFWSSSRLFLEASSMILALCMLYLRVVTTRHSSLIASCSTEWMCLLLRPSASGPFLSS